MKTISITLPVYPSGNRYKGRFGAQRYAGFKRKIKQALKGYQLLAPKEDLRADVEITRYGSRLLDEDNLHFGSKSVIDVLRELGFFPDDSPKWITTTWHQVKSKRIDAKTVVVISWKKEA